MTPDAPLLLAHHPLIIAVPFVVPAVIVSAVVGMAVWRDRHSPEDADTAESTDGHPGGR